MMKKLYFLSFLLLVSGCSNNSLELQSTKIELEQVKQQNTELELQLNKLSKELESKQKEYELRNILDIKAREIFRLMAENKETELRPHLSKKLTATNKTIIYFVDDQQVSVPFVTDRDTFRQRFYSLDKEDSFITGYEVWHPGSTQSILILNFVLKDNDWMLDEINTDI